MINKADDEWELYVGMLFAKIIKDYNLTNCNTILEIAPGFRYKIAYALKEINFCGKLYILDSSKEVCKYVNKTYKQILPNAQIIILNEDFNNIINKLPPIDLLLGNHIIDDLIIYNYLNVDYKINEDIQNNLFLAWEKLYNYNDKEKIISNIQTVFNKIFKKINFCILSQYKSNVYLKNNEYENLITSNCFYKIKNMINYNDNRLEKSLSYHPFENDERYLLPDLLSNVQNPKNWIVGLPKS